MENESARLMTAILPVSWIIRPIAKDYGVDYEIELVDENIVTGNRVWIQLKSIMKATPRTVSFDVSESFPELVSKATGKLDVEYVAYSMETKNLNYSLKCAFPLLLLLADLENREIYWLPIRDEILGNLNSQHPDWPSQETATLRIPTWNRLTLEREHGFPGLNWYALEPARMYAFATLQYYYHECQNECSLSGYQIGNGWIDHGEEKKLRCSLSLALRYISAALKLDVLFGEQGIDYFRSSGLEPVGLVSIGSQLEQGLRSAKLAQQMLDKHDYSFVKLSMLLGSVQHAINLFSTAISSYEGFRQKYLITEGTAVWRAAAFLHGRGGAPLPPIRNLSF